LTCDFARHNYCTAVSGKEKAILPIFIGLRKAKVGFFIGPISKRCWATQTKTVEGEVRVLLEEELNEAGREVKE